MKNRVTKCLVMGALAIGMTSNAMAAEDKQLCFQINGDINNSLQTYKTYLTVNSVGVATGNGCFYSISDPSSTPSCSPVIGNLTGKFPEAFLSLHGNWQRTVGSDVVSEDTKVSAHYDFKKLSGEGIAKTLKTIGNAPIHEVNSSEGSVSRIACPKPVANPIKNLPKLSLDLHPPVPVPASLNVQPGVGSQSLVTPTAAAACIGGAVAQCTGMTQSACTGYLSGGGVRSNWQCSWGGTPAACVNWAPCQ